ncbi:hypothetical protein MIND_01288700 [Mycena indigotica]|uniref:Uncharacterized protein n=1 Tax=Mycena indigotica TaxID=2126181 RepID=A0A8H6VTJ4_9AGAR|nr:uncharacterized protein MIND_01288700 [Mycena indigotica]KAF7291436.1 hypothetical protein MIND_01288700 [Mycena indigotica]
MQWDKIEFFSLPSSYTPSATGGFRVCDDNDKRASLRSRGHSEDKLKTVDRRPPPKAQRTSAFVSLVSPPIPMSLRLTLEFIPSNHNCRPKCLFRSHCASSHTLSPSTSRARACVSLSQPCRNRAPFPKWQVARHRAKNYNATKNHDTYGDRIPH